MQNERKKKKRMRKVKQINKFRKLLFKIRFIHIRDSLFFNPMYSLIGFCSSGIGQSKKIFIRELIINTNLIMKFVREKERNPHRKK